MSIYYYLISGMELYASASATIVHGANCSVYDCFLWKREKYGKYSAAFGRE